MMKYQAHTNIYVLIIRDEFTKFALSMSVFLIVTNEMRFPYIYESNSNGLLVNYLNNQAVVNYPQSENSNP